MRDNPPPEMTLHWGFESAADGRRLTVALGLGEDNPQEPRNLKAFVWAYGGTRLDGEQMQLIDLGDLAAGKCVSRSWSSSEPHTHSLFVSCDDRIVYSRDIKPKGP